MSDKVEEKVNATVVKVITEEADPEADFDSDHSSAVVRKISHFRHEAAHSAFVRYGYVVALMVILAILIVADLASGITTYYTHILDGEIRGITFFDKIAEPGESMTILSSMKESWDVGAKGTAITIFISSIWWPYAKLFLLACFWFVPFNPMSRKGKMERCIEVVELFGKWSLLDIFLFIVYIVAFDIRSESSGIMTIEDGVNINGTLTSSGTTKIDPRWGMSLFTFTSVLAFFISHYMLWTHRQVFYEGRGATRRLTQAPDDSKKTMTERTGKKMIFIISILLLALGFDFAGYFMKSMKFNFLKPNIPNEPVPEVVKDMNMTLMLVMDDLPSYSREFSMASIGIQFLDGTKSRNTFNTRAVQFFYYLMTMVTPILNIFFYLILYTVPLTRDVQKIVFHLGEYAYAWNAYGVMAIVIFASYFQIPSFNGDTEKQCGVFCHIAETEFLNGYIFTTIAWTFQLAVNYVVGNGAHKALYTSQIVGNW